jgi:hypothetical protein
MPMNPREITVLAVWDPEAEVFVVTSEDVPGLVAEAATWREIDEKLQVLIPELLELNGVAGLSGDRFEDVPVVIRTEQKSTVRVHA